MPTHIRPSNDEFLGSAGSTINWGQINVLDLGTQPAGTYLMSAMQRLSAVLPSGTDSTTGTGKISVNGVTVSGELDHNPIRVLPDTHAIVCLYPHPGGPMLVQSLARVNTWNGQARTSSRLDVIRVA